MPEVIITGLDGMLATLQQLPPEIVSKRGGPVKSALLQAARVLQREAVLNLARVTDNLTADGEDHSTGLLQRSLISSRGKPPSGENGERYLVRIKRKIYQRFGKAVSTVQTANYLERGTEKQPAEPWARPAFNAKAGQAASTFVAELKKRSEAIVTKLARQNRR